MTCLFILFLLFIYFLWLYYKKWKLLQFSRLQNGPKPYPILGNVPVFFKQNILDGMIELKERYSLPCNFWIWNDYYYVTDCPHEIKTLLSNTSKSFQKAPFYNDLVQIIMEDTLLLFPASKVKKWKFERQIVSKAFAPSMWPKYTPVFHEKVTVLLEGLEEIGDFHSLLSVLTRNSFEIFMENFMGIKTENTLEESELLEALTQVTEIPAQRSALNRLLPRWYYKYFNEEGRQLYRTINYIKKQLKQLIERKRCEFYGKNEFSECNKKPLLIESLLLKEDSQFNVNDISRQIILIYITSIDTSVLMLAYTLLQLGMNSEIQDNVFEEILQFTGEAGEITVKYLPNLKYLEQCVCETVRIFPVVPIVGRHITEDINLGSKILPKGANAFISPYLLHRNEKYWQNPEKFDPSRFSKENCKNIALGSYCPFLMGPRDCLGRHYSMAQVKIMAANVIRKYRIQVDPRVAENMKFKYYILMKPSVNFNIQFVPRNINRE